MKKAWRKLLVAGCVVSLLMSVPGVSVLAGELHDEQFIIDQAEEPESIGEYGELVVEDEDADEIVEEFVNQIEETEELDDVDNFEEEFNDEVGGAGNILVGENVTASFDASTGAVEFYSNDGTLWRDWLEKSGIDVLSIKSIKVASGIVYLPKNSGKIFSVYKSLDDGGRMSNLKSLDLSSFDTTNVTYMDAMFQNNYGITDLDLSSFNTSKVTNMSYMFSGCTSLTSLDLSRFDTSNVATMSFMFNKCKSLGSLDLSNFNTSNVKNVGSMFEECSGLIDLDLSGFDLSNVVNNSTINNYTPHLLRGCTSLKLLYTPKMNTLTDIALPTAMYDSDGKVYNKLPTTSKSITLTKRVDISNCRMTVSPSSYVYDGKAKQPNVTVKDSKGILLVEGSDYTVEYSNNINAGRATIIVMGIGYNTGKKNSTFSIGKASPILKFANSSLTKKATDAAFTNTLTKTTDGTISFKSSDTSVAIVDNTGKVTIKDVGTTTITVNAAEGTNYKTGSASYSLTVVDDRIDISTCTISLSATSFTYNGKENKPTVIVKDGTKTLTLDKDYSVAYADNINAGKATVTVTGKNNYKGLNTVQFTINKANPILKFTSASVKKKPGDAVFTNKLIKTTDGTVTFKSGNTSVATVNSTSGKVTIKGEGKTTITATAVEGSNYKQGNASYTLTVAGDAISDTISIHHWGEDVENTFTVSFDKSLLNVEDAITLHNFSGKTITGLKVSLQSASHIQFDPQQSEELSKGIDLKPDEYYSVEFVPDGRGNISGSLQLSATNYSTLNIKIDGYSDFYDTSHVFRMVKYVPVSYIVSSHSGSVTGIEGTLPKGVSYIASTKELYGIPMETGEIKINLVTNKGTKESCTLHVYNNEDYYVMSCMYESKFSSVLYGSRTYVGFGMPGAEEVGKSIYAVSPESSQDFISDGEFKYLKKVWLNGKELIKGTDYTVQEYGEPEGATKIVLNSSTLKNKTNKILESELERICNGESDDYSCANTLAAEFVTSPSGIVRGDYHRTSSENFYVIGNPTVSVLSFSDVQDPSHAFYKAIYWAADAGITKGYPDGTFGIDRSCTRGEMIMFLWRYAGKPAAKVVTKSPFSDVPKTHSFYNAILWGSQKGITKGYPDGTFGINRNVSRGECMMFLWRLKGKPTPKAVSVSPFKDVPKTHAFYNAILWGAQKKITNGYTSGAKKGTFGINENCTRGAIVTFLYRAR